MTVVFYRHHTSVVHVRSQRHGSIWFGGERVFRLSLSLSVSIFVILSLSSFVLFMRPLFLGLCLLSTLLA